VADIKLKAGTPQTLEASGGSVSDAAWGTANDADLDNTTQLAMFYNFALTCGFGSSVTALEDINLYLVPKLDGTNEADIDTANDNAQPSTFAGIFVNASSGTSSRILTLEGVQVGPCKYVAYIENKSGQTISSGWTLVAYPVLKQSV
jgi:hypothetical protein